MFGKIFSSMYTGSLVGSGATVFAVMGYIISCTKPDKSVGGQVELNPVILAAIIGEPQDKVQEAIEFLCKPDPRSRSKECDGRRLIKLGEFDYRVVNFEKYRDMKNEEARREQNRAAQARYRYKVKAGKPLPGEMAYDAACRSGDEERMQKTEASA